MDDPLLGKQLKLKATEVQKGDFLIHEEEQSTFEVIDVHVSQDDVIVVLAGTGFSHLEPEWDVALYRKQD